MHRGTEVRKLKPAEVTALVAALTIGSGDIEASETSVIATVTVTASSLSVNVVPRFILTPGTIGYGQVPTQAGNNSSTLQAQYQKAINCALKYGQTRSAVPKDGYVTYFDMNYGWGQSNGNAYASYDGTNPPPGTGWFRIDGVTSHYHPAAPFILGQSNIFLSGMDTATIINTVAHEWAHQWKIPDSQAYAIGDAVEAAWRADNGALCGGM